MPVKNKIQTYYSKFSVFRCLCYIFKLFLLAFILFVFDVYNVQAQKNRKVSAFYPHEIGVGLGAGASFLNYTPSIGSITAFSRLGGEAGFSYAFFFMEDWSILTGLNLDLYTAELKLPDGFSRSYDATSKGGLLPNSNFTFTYTLYDYTETQRALYLSIPLMLQFQTWGKYKFFVALGLKVAFPVSASCSADSYQLFTKGYFPLEGRTYDDIPKYGFGQFEPASKESLDMKSVFFLSLEYGLKCLIKDNHSLYIGLYIDYTTLSSMQNHSEAQVFYEYTGTDKGPNSLLTSKIDGQNIVTDINPSAIGIKARYSFGIKEKKKWRR